MKHLSGEILSAFVEGELEREDRALLQRHLDGCEECRTSMEELRRMLTALDKLPDREPRKDLWIGIRGRIMPSTAEAVVRPDRSMGWFPFSPALGVAATVVILASVVGIWFLIRGSAPAEPPSPEVPSVVLSLDEMERMRMEAYLEAIRDVEGVLAGMEERLDPVSTTMVRNEMRLLDRSVEEIREALEENPENAWLRERLARTLHRKWTYLREAASLAPPRFPLGG